MKQGSSQQRRGRSRGNGGRRNPSNRNNNLESNGPGGKVRGTAQQVLDKYLFLARDASSSGEHIAAEAFYQYAEHYQRLLNAEAANNLNHNQHHHHRNHNQRDEQKPHDGGDGRDKGKGQQIAASENARPVEAGSDSAEGEGAGGAADDKPADPVPEKPELAASA